MDTVRQVKVNLLTRCRTMTLAGSVAGIRLVTSRQARDETSSRPPTNAHTISQARGILLAHSALLVNETMKRLLSKLFRILPTKRDIGPTSEVAETNSPSHSERIRNEVALLDFPAAQHIVVPFGEKLFQKALIKCPLHVGGREVTRDSAFYSKVNLTVSRADTISAFKCYFVSVKSDDAAEAAFQTIWSRLFRVVPDDYAEPLQLDDVDELEKKRESLYAQFVVDEPALRALRTENLLKNAVFETSIAASVAKSRLEAYRTTER